MQTRLDGKLALLYTLLVLQVLIVMIYVATTPPPEPAASTIRDSVTFVKLEEPSDPRNGRLARNKVPAYQTINGEVTLRDIKTFRLFEVYNRTVCWKYGVNNQKMIHNEDLEKCVCDQGWHGSDCGQPEVVWRAIMASKQNIILKRRKLARRVIHTFFLTEYNSAIAEVIVEELYGVVDLFVICDYNNSEDNYRHKLFKGLLRREQRKILYIDVSSFSRKPLRVVSGHVWERIKRVVTNLRDDDIHVITEPEQVLNPRALMFLKVYNGWPQPIGFRLRWSVYGFFWQHPLKTSTMVGACTVGMMREAYHDTGPMMMLHRQRFDGSADGDPGERDTLGLVIGDLNHYGGWYCNYCQQPASIMIGLRERGLAARSVNVEKKTIDVPYVEDLIGGGLWIDARTSLLRVTRSRDTYFAPETILNNTWKYDWLVENFYAKLDYY